MYCIIIVFHCSVGPCRLRILLGASDNRLSNLVGSINGVKRCHPGKVAQHGEEKPLFQGNPINIFLKVIFPDIGYDKYKHIF